MRAEPARTGGYWPTQYGPGSQRRALSVQKMMLPSGGGDSGADTQEGALNVRLASLEPRDPVTPDDSLRKNLALRAWGAP